MPVIIVAGVEPANYQPIVVTTTIAYSQTHKKAKPRVKAFSTNILILLGWLIWILFKKKQGRYKYALTKKDKSFLKNDQIGMCSPKKIIERKVEFIIIFINDFWFVIRIR
jgi:hypothetical protein